MRNRIAVFMMFVTAASLLITPIEALRGGGGGGRGGGGRAGGGGSRGGGGAYRGGNTMYRTPTMSRASNRAPSTAMRQNQARTPASANRMQQSRQTPYQKPTAANRSQLRQQVNQYAQNKPKPNIDRQALAQKGQNFATQHSGQLAQNRQLSDSVSQRLQQTHPDSNHWFNGNFFDRHNVNVDYARVGANWWQPAAWSALATWGAWNWSTPYYYDEDYAYPMTPPPTEPSATYSYSTNKNPATHCVSQ